MLKEVRALAEVVVLAVLKHKQAVFFEQRGTHHPVRQFAQFWQRIWRVGKHKTKSLVATVYEAQSVPAHGAPSLVGQGFLTLGNEAVMTPVLLHRHHALATTREQLQRYAPSSSEEVECLRFFKVEVCAQHIEKVFLGKVCGGAGLEGAWHIEVPSLIFSGYDSHVDGF